MSLARNIGDLPNGDDAPLFGCRAWINFNGTGTIAIRDSGNVTSITDNGTGDYTVTFTTVMPDANYSAVLSAGRTQDTTNAMRVGVIKGPPNASFVRIATCSSDNSTSDANEVCAAIFR